MLHLKDGSVRGLTLGDLRESCLIYFHLGGKVLGHPALQTVILSCIKTG